jgi:predicted SnoaL-like aldol condensation-catalyzing enzyme
MTTVVKEKATSAIEQNKDLIRKAVEEIWNKGNFDMLEEMVSDDFVIHFPREELRGIENIKEFYTELRKAFPDIRFTIVEQVADEDKVVTHWSADRYS